MLRAAVTGAAGFVGRKLCQRLLDLGYHVTMIDNLSSGIHPATWAPLDNNYLFYQSDVRDFFRENSQWKFDLVFHLAAVVGGRLTIDGDPLRVATDLSIDAEFFNWLTRQTNKPKKAVYFSSSAAYPIQLQRQSSYCKLSERFIDFGNTRIGMPDMTYGWAKLTGEFLAQQAVKKYNLDVVIYRPFSGYGEDQSLDYPFPSIVKRVLDRENPVVVWGSGKQERDFIHIDDVIDGVFVTMDKIPTGEALNLGTGEPTTFTSLAKLAGSVVGRPIEVKNDPSKPEGVFSRVCDPWKLNQWFTPKISLREGLKRALTALDTAKTGL